MHWSPRSRAWNSALFQAVNSEANPMMMVTGFSWAMPSFTTESFALWKPPRIGFGWIWNLMLHDVSIEDGWRVIFCGHIHLNRRRTPP